MSVILLVKLSRSMPLDETEGVTSLALRELLNLDRNPDLTASFDESDRGGRPSDGLLSEKSNRVLCALPGYAEKAALTPMTIPVQVATNDGSNFFADQAYLSIGWLFKKSPLCWALVGAAALGIARNLRSEIEDNAGFFTIANVQGPDEFFRTLRVSTPQADPESAAEALYSRMPRSTEIEQSLRQ